MAEFVAKCFLLRENLIVSILKMATGKKELEDLDIEDAAKLTIVHRAGEIGKETVLFNGIEIGTITCDLPEAGVVYTFTPLNLNRNERNY